ncbi:MAG: hypothetical protein Q9162_002174 [Coniocarpon cinnabarinum]
MEARKNLELPADDNLHTLDFESENEVDDEEQSDWEWIYSPSSDLNSHEDDSTEELDSGLRHSSRKRKRTSNAWLPSDDQRIVGARLGSFTVRLGDAVTLRADRNDTWVAIITAFIDPSAEACEHESQNNAADLEKTARFMWLSSTKDIHNKSKRRQDAMPNERYMTSSTDENPLEAISGRAVIMSPAQFAENYPTGKVPRNDPDFGHVFVCRRGVTLRTATYTEEFVWEDMFRGVDSLPTLEAKIEAETIATRRKGASRHRGLTDFVIADNVDDRDFDDERATPRTPRKKRKLMGTDRTPTKRTPQKRDTPKTTSLYETPTHRRVVEKKPLEFTPLGTRILSPSQHSLLTTPLARAKTHLHVSAVPASLPCRENEFEIVHSHLESAITSGLGTCIYIAGTPGTGKTATVREVVASLHASVDCEELDDFIFVEINGMKVTEPSQSYSLLWEALTSQRVSPAQSLTLLSREFSRPSPRRVPCVVLMDELDQLATKTQNVMYNFFNWPQLRHSRLIVLAVANTMDLPERTLSNKISSRLGLTRVTFQGYTHAQLMKIVESRLESVSGTHGEIFVESDAIQFASRKVAQVSGDARRCLDICRRAVEIAEVEAEVRAKEDGNLPWVNNGSDKENVPDTPSKTGRNSKRESTARATQRDDKRGRVTIGTIQRAIREATSSPLQSYLKTTSLSAKFFLAALVARSRRTGLAETTLGDILDEAKKIGRMSELPGLREWLLTEHSPSADGPAGGDVVHQKTHLPRVLGMGAAAIELLEAGVVVIEQNNGEREARVRLQASEEEVKSALKDDEEVKGLGFQ